MPANTGGLFLFFPRLSIDSYLEIAYNCLRYDHLEVYMVQVSKTDLRKWAVAKSSKKSASRKSPSSRNRHAVFVEFPLPLNERLEAAAKSLNVTKSEIVREATASALDALEGVKAK